MKIQTVVYRYYDENCYIIWDGEGGKCAVIDPASQDVAAAVEALGLEPECVLLTHGHFDHICGVNEFLAKYDVPLYIHEDDAELLSDGYKNASALLARCNVTVHKAPKTLADGDVLDIGALRIKTLHTPGHTRGCVCYFCGNAVFTGDTVFAYDRGRTDLYGGDEKTIVDSINKLTPMLSGKTVYPGHGQARKF